MTASVDIVNRALQSIGTRTTVTAGELVSLTSNEAIQASLVLTQLRDQLMRMAPWNCGRNYANLTLITAQAGTPENQTAGQATWSKGLPPPPWTYEYQYPIDCLRPLYVIPQFTTGFASGIPITTAVTGGAPSFWMGPPQKYQVALDQFFPVTSATVASGGSGHVVGDVITLASGPITSPPIGAPAQLQVTAAPGGVITTVSIVNLVQGESPPISGSYFKVQPSPVAQGSTTGVGIGATFNLVFGPVGDQRVILSNQESATIAYMRQVIDPNVMDPLYQEAWISILAARLAMSLTGDKAIANGKIAEANAIIVEARKADGNENLTINDVTPDFMRARGIYYPTWEISPNVMYDWGPMFSSY